MLEVKNKEKIKKRIKIGKVQRLVLLLALHGLALGSAYTIKRQKKIYDGVKTELGNYTNGHIKRASAALFRARLATEKSNADGTTTIELTEKGKQYALTFDIENMKLPRPNKWDGKWRIIIYDIPVRLNKLRESLRYQLRQIGMVELQRSVFIYPHSCHQEIRYIIEFYNAWEYVRFILAEFIDNEQELKKQFEIS